MVVLATLASVIASQAVISGAYSMTKQAIQLGLLPRMRVLHTSEQEAGQIYIPFVNWFVMLAVLLAMLGFGSSSALGLGLRHRRDGDDVHHHAAHLLRRPPRLGLSVAAARWRRPGSSSSSTPCSWPRVP